MAARTAIPSREQQERTRAAIKTSQLINRLQGFALGESDPKTAELIEIDSGRLKAIEILLRKSLPDLANITHSGDADAPVKMEIVWAGEG
jgi:hypothetical protein